MFFVNLTDKLKVEEGEEITWISHLTDLVKLFPDYNF